ncbi:hypothetical protein J132_06961 [Termitomyces sp. J132]|nr:hypothetical protein J132_06961 [Termitomyces sp. J132]
MVGHDSVLAAQVKQTRLANHKHKSVSFIEGDLVYVSMKNLTYPKGLACKLIPKFMGPHSILADYGNQSFCVKLPASMKQCGVHDIFHAFLLRIHIPNDDHLFPGWLDEQVVEPQQHPIEWVAQKIVSHAGSGAHLLFEVLWKLGDRTWLLYDQVEDLTLLQLYLDAIPLNNS